MNKIPIGQDAQECILEFLMTQCTKVFHCIQNGCSEDFIEEKNLTALTTLAHSHNTCQTSNLQKMARHCYKWLLIFLPFFSYSLAIVFIVFSSKNSLWLQISSTEPAVSLFFYTKLKPTNVITIYKSNMIVVS